MVKPFLVLAAVSPTRQQSFRRTVMAHLLVVGTLGLGLIQQGSRANPALLGYVLVTLGIIEGALLLGWRLTQIPKSQALEFLLVSPLQPRWVFLGEALVGLAYLGLVTLSGLPILALLVALGSLDPADLLVLIGLPFTWAAITGLGLSVWAYEARRTRQVGEVVLMGLVLLYLIVGVLAGEKLRDWVERLPQSARGAILRGVQAVHEHNPFGTIRYWFAEDVPLAWQRVAWFEAASLALAVLLLVRGAWRLLGHFHERHYEPARDVSADRRPAIGDRPLSWWAVKRVSEYSGRINLWLAGGFCLLYATYLVAEASWPTWMGRRIFELCDAIGGVATLSAALIVLAAVPAAFQYGLWDSSVQDRCRRLELLLLTNLQPIDYWCAALSAAWRRGQGYVALAVLLWLAALVGGKLGVKEVLAAGAGAVLLWGLYFALGFRAFAHGAQANGLGMMLTVGLPLFAWALGRAGWTLAASWLPPGMVYRAAAGPYPIAWLIGPFLMALSTVLVARQTLAQCDARLRQWYDQNHGNKVMS